MICTFCGFETAPLAYHDPGDCVEVLMAMRGCSLETMASAIWRELCDAKANLAVAKQRIVEIEERS